MKKLVLIDVDNTLTIGECWTEEECLHAIPNKETIDFVNSIYGKHVIIAYTARDESLRFATEYWLKKNGVKYHALNMGKTGCDVFFDDKTVSNLKDLNKWLEK